jgi:hypothetical protein
MSLGRHGGLALLLGLTLWVGHALAQDIASQRQAVASLADPLHLSLNGLTVYAEAAKKWEKDVSKLAETNTSEGGDDAVLFLGSSSIRLWESIDTDIAPFHAVRRGYGGAKYCDLAIYTPVLIEGLRFRRAVVFIGNDVMGKPDDKEPEEVARLSRIVIESIRRVNPDAPILLVSVTATPARFAHWARIEAVNEALQRVAKSLPRVEFLDTKSSYLTGAKEPKTELFGKDKLHQNSDGYKQWGSLIRERLAK